MQWRCHGSPEPGRSHLSFTNFFCARSPPLPFFLRRLTPYSRREMHFTSIAILPFTLAVLAAAGPIVDKRASFTKQNGLDAQQLNTKFESLSLSSSCTPGENACVSGAFAQCANGKFVSFPCSGGLTCVALPLVNSPGTSAFSITCDTEQDAANRIAQTGASGGLTGRSIESRSSFLLQNGQDAQKLNAKFETLSATSSCTSGDQACINGQFAQCANGNFVLTPCSAGLKCVALPLVLKPGTSIACDTPADASARISSTGAQGGLNGRSFLETRAANAPAACASKKRSDITERSNAPVVKRIAQTDLPALAGINGINALLANADPCAQQVNADAMIDFAKSNGITNKSALIANAIAYAKHPRNALNINGVVPSTPFCQNAPKNAELNGIAHAQLAGVNPGLFGSPALGIFAFGDPRSCPFGKKPDVNTCECN
ncbi:hypothetical protein A0H81_11739 [Grifola frondosa]|uniref:Carbohydrate-binding module family 19 domain-containing protein n=1 Tax=Grifola frondosa TaxID=5627 RepID=A0A1C7LV86_GRIFR|nr:hypothetical protein A0H81_11739 [Grifola frondosa]